MPFPFHSPLSSACGFVVGLHCVNAFFIHSLVEDTTLRCGWAASIARNSSWCVFVLASLESHLRFFVGCCADCHQRESLSHALSDQSTNQARVGGLADRLVGRVVAHARCRPKQWTSLGQPRFAHYSLNRHCHCHHHHHINHHDHHRPLWLQTTPLGRPSRRPYR